MWNELKYSDEFYSKHYWEWQSKGVDLGGKIQADVLFSEYVPRQPHSPTTLAL